MNQFKKLAITITVDGKQITPDITVDGDLHRELCKRHGPLFVDETLELLAAEILHQLRLKVFN